MEIKDLPNWQAFEHELDELRAQLKYLNTSLLFRGQADSDWPLSTTLERAGCDGLQFDTYSRVGLLERSRATLFSAFPRSSVVSLHGLPPPPWTPFAITGLDPIASRRGILCLSGSDHDVAEESDLRLLRNAHGS